MCSLPRLGDFGTSVGAFAPSFADFDPAEPQYGLRLICEYIVGGVRGADGTNYVIGRKFIGPVSGGLWYMSDRSGALRLLPESTRAMKGEVRRSSTEHTRRWSQPLMHRLPDDLLIEGEGGVEIELSDTELRWSEGQLFSVHGRRAAGALSLLHLPMRGEKLHYLSIPHWVEGTVEGQPVDGVIFFDYAYWGTGGDYKESQFFNNHGLVWHEFCNRFTDGTFEAGLIVKGNNNLSACAVVEGDKVITTSNRLDVTVSLDEDGFQTKTVFASQDYDWEFTGPAGSRYVEFSKARHLPYRSQNGISRRRDDDRELDFGFGWMDGFPERLHGDGLVI
jgi:hypothetical protein